MPEYESFKNWWSILGASFVGVVVRILWAHYKRRPWKITRFIGEILVANTLLRIERLEREIANVETEALKRENLLLRTRFRGGNGSRSDALDTTPPTSNTDKTTPNGARERSD